MSSRSFWKVFFVGLLGGAADAVPGISGGTIYYIVGIYEEMLQSLKNCWLSLGSSITQCSLKPVLREQSWKYVGVLLSGVLISFFALAKSLLIGLEHPVFRPVLLSLFLGFVGGSSYVCLRSIESWKTTRASCLLTGFVLGIVLISGPKFDSEPRYSVPIRAIELPEAHNVSNDHQVLTQVPHSALVIIKSQGLIADEDCVIDQERGESVPVKMIAKGDISLLRLDLIAAGVLTISALLLPGLSGAYVVDLLGVYGSIMSAVLDISSGALKTTFSSTSCFHVANLIAGMVMGTLLFSQTTLWLCARFHNATNAFLSGCMIGSMWAIWPFQNLVREINPFRIADGPHVVSMGNYWPSLQQLSSVWYIPILTVVSASCVLFLHRLVGFRKTNACSPVFPSRRILP